jgi:glycosyltransferase involved in cell wall biosynthesis
MKIVMATYHSLAIDHGGPRVQILQTANELDKRGVEVSLFDSWSTLSKSNCDLVHLFGARVGTFQLARTLAIADIPFVVSPIFYTLHSPAAIRAATIVESMLKKIRKGLWTDYGFTKQICLWSSKVLPNTSDEGKLLERGMAISPEKITMIPNGVDARFEFADPAIFKKQYGLENFILNVGHIGPARKNVLNLIRALKTIDHPAVIIGRISNDAQGKQCVEEASKNKNILLIPGLDHDSEMLASAYSACDTFVLPSLFETPGIAALEAGLAGAKIVITPRGGTKEYFGTMAEYVEPRSIPSIQQGIMAALNKNPNSTLQHHIKKEFLWDKIAEKTLAIYSTLVRP